MMLALKNSRVASKAVHSPKDWTYPELKEIDSLLRCPICYDFIHTAMILPECSHTFCSLCIRQHLSLTNKCPVCNSAACENNLRNNRLVDDLILQFKSIRSHLLEVTVKYSTEKAGSYCNQNKKTLEETQTQILLPISKDNAAAKDVAIIDLISEDGDESDQDFVNVKSIEDKENITEVDQGLYTPKAKAGTRLSDLNMTGESSTPKTVIPSHLNMLSPSPRNMVSCPVCGISLKESAMNDHLDVCLGGEEKKSALRKQTPKKKPMAKLVYNLMSERDIKKKLKEVGLSTTGDKKTLIRRHHDFVMLYNSECDSLNPRSVQDIVKQVEKMEDVRHRNRRDNNRLGIEKNSSPASIEKAQKVYLKKHKSHFSNLIEETRQRMRDQKAERKKSEVKENYEGNWTSATELDETGTEWTQNESDGDSRRTSIRNRRNKEIETRRGTDGRISEIDVDDVEVVSSQSESGGRRRSTRNREKTKVVEVIQRETSGEEASDLEIISLESETESESERSLKHPPKSTQSRNTLVQTSESGTSKADEGGRKLSRRTRKETVDVNNASELEVQTETLDESWKKSLRTRKKAGTEKMADKSGSHISGNKRIQDQESGHKTRGKNEPFIGKKTSDSVSHDDGNKYDGQTSQRKTRRSYNKHLSHSESPKNKKTCLDAEVEEISKTSHVEKGMDEQLEELVIEESRRRNFSTSIVIRNEDVTPNVVLGVEKGIELRKSKTTSSSGSPIKEMNNSEDKFVCVASVYRNNPSADLIINVPVDLQKINWTEKDEDEQKKDRIQRQFLGSPIRIPEIDRNHSAEEGEDVQILSSDDNMDMYKGSVEKDANKQRSNSEKSHTKVKKHSSRELMGHCYDVDPIERDVAELETYKIPAGKSVALPFEEQSCQKRENMMEDQEEDESLQVDETPVKDYDLGNVSTLWPALSGGLDVSRARARHFSSISTQSNKSNCSDLSMVFSPINNEEDIQREGKRTRSSSRRDVLEHFENRKRKRPNEPASRKRRRK